MARTGFRSGDRERAKARFRRLPEAVRKGTQRALLEAATELAGAIKRAVPVARGDLRDSVRVKRGKAASRDQQAGVDPDLTIRVTEGDRDTFYAPFVEFGTADQPAQPHFFPTYRANRKRLARQIKAAQRRAIKKGVTDV